MADKVDVRAVLREYAQDSGSFRVNKQAASDLAAACAAAVELIDLVGPFLEKLRFYEDGDHGHPDSDTIAHVRQGRQNIVTVGEHRTLRAALARIGAA